MNADLLTRLIEAGTPAALVAEVAAELARVEAVADARIEAAAAPSAGALRTRRWRERHAPSQSVTCDAGDAQVTENVTAPAPSPPPLLSPQTPQTTPPPHPHPEGFDAHTRGGWPRGMPPPPEVSAAQWAGFVAHRKKLRKALTPRAYDLLCGKLVELGDAGWPPGEMIDRAILHGWLTVFPPDEKTNGKRTHHHDRPSGWRSGDLPAGAEPASLDD